jgi:hypothetical protein
LSYIPPNPNGQATMANSAPVVIASNQTSLPISDTTLGTLSVNNSSTVQLSAGAYFTGVSDDLINCAEVSISIYTDVPSTAGGIWVYWSNDNLNFQVRDSYDLPAGGWMLKNIAPKMRYMYVVYRNGILDQNFFAMVVTLRKNATANTDTVDALNTLNDTYSAITQSDGNKLQMRSHDNLTHDLLWQILDELKYLNERK